MVGAHRGHRARRDRDCALNHVLTEERLDRGRHPDDRLAKPNTRTLCLSSTDIHREPVKMGASAWGENVGMGVGTAKRAEWGAA